MSVPKHHVRAEVCSSRAPYREGRKAKAVKVYTVNQESQYLLVQGVPNVGATTELIKLFALHGAVQEYRILDDYPAESFTDVYLIKFQKIMSARIAKRKLDDWSFFGGVLHVCYAPEYETVQETREKLQERRRSIAAKIRQYAQDGTYSSSAHQSQSGRRQSETALHSGRVRETTHQIPLQTPDLRNSSSSSQITNSQRHVETDTHLNTGRLNTPGGNRLDHSSSVSKERIHKQTDGQQTNYSNVHLPYKQHSDSETSQQHSYEGNTEQEQVQMWLPAPPKPGVSHHGGIPTNKRHLNAPGYNFARVPTANAVFPEGFDARIDKKIRKETDSNRYETFTVEIEEYDAEDGVQEMKKTMQEKIDENLKSRTPVVIKSFSKSSNTPKFIPRQAQVKQKQTTVPKANDKPRDALDQQLKRDAFTLKDVQGPTHPNREPKPEPDPGEVSVNKTVKDIRKKIKQLSEDAISRTKKQKIDIT